VIKNDKTNNHNDYACDQGRIWTKLLFFLHITLPYLANLFSRVSPKMNFSETGLMCTYLSVLNVKNGPRGAKIKNLIAFLSIFSFHGRQ
jgi:hypothetical protein